MTHQAPLLIAGETRWRDPRPVIDPFDESVAGEHAFASAQDLEDAVAAAHAARPVWEALGPAARETILRGAAALLRERTETIALIMTAEQGKPLAQSRSEIAYSAAMIEWDAGEGRRLYGRLVPTAAGQQAAVHRRPVGPVAAFSPWNFPVSSPTKKISAPLAAGCPVIIKPSEETPGSAYEVVRAFHDAGVPPGVIGLVYGDPAAISETLIADDRMRAVTFTGSVPVGKRLGALAGAALKPALLELGGHGPVFVSATADVEAAADMGVASKAINAGQMCVSPTRFFIEEAAYCRFSARFVERARSLRYGDGRDPATELGPLASARRRASVEALIEDAAARGAQVLARGERVGNKGIGLTMTVLGEVPDQARIMIEEPFGPVAILNPVRDVEEAIVRANANCFGLAGYAFTRSARDIQRLTESLEVGALGVNQFSGAILETPFGGVKDSGLNRSGGSEGLDIFTETKTVVTRFV